MVVSNEGFRISLHGRGLVLQSFFEKEFLYFKKETKIQKTFAISQMRKRTCSQLIVLSYAHHFMIRCYVVGAI